MSQQPFDDATLMAYADGELDQETVIRLEAALANDADLRQRVAMFRKTRQLAKDAVRAAYDAPVPEALQQKVESLVKQDAEHSSEPARDNVVPFAAAGKPSTAAPPRSRFALPMAASIALVVGLLGGLAINRLAVDSGAPVEIAILQQEGLADALGRVASGATAQLGGGDDRFRAIASFKDDGGAFCREFEVDQQDRTTLVAVACRQERKWNVQFAVVAGSSAEGYAPASSLEALDAYLSSIGASETLSADEEQQELRSING